MRRGGRVRADGGRRRYPAERRAAQAAADATGTRLQDSGASRAHELANLVRIDHGSSRGGRTLAHPGRTGVPGREGRLSAGDSPAAVRSKRRRGEAGGRGRPRRDRVVPCNRHRQPVRRHCHVVGPARRGQAQRGVR
ncbi:MAG: hypothetical protein FJ276_17580, partial [Planctomycetes bacterium]|nr:hypothetical protein [Planctomycetota bacterium]